MFATSHNSYLLIAICANVSAAVQILAASIVRRLMLRQETIATSKTRPRNMAALYSEDSSDWMAMPRWVDFLIRVGFTWPDDVNRQRRIALISMPCDSEAAGLVALGAHTRDLCRPAANDVDGHYAALIRYARQYLARCATCTSRCNPAEVRCGFAAEATGRLMTIRAEHKRGYMVSDITKSGDLEVVFHTGKNGDVKIPLTPQNATDYYVVGEPPPVFSHAQDGLQGGGYAEIVEQAQIFSDNLRKSFSGTCLAGRASGLAAARAAYASIRFACNSGDYRLLDLLTVQDWTGHNRVSRMTYFNTRTGKFDRSTSPPGLVIADGDAPFMSVLGRQEFSRSDVIGVYHRLIDRERLEELGAKLLGLGQWYEPDLQMNEQFADVPKGVSIAFLKKRMS